MTPKQQHLENESQAEGRPPFKPMKQVGGTYYDERTPDAVVQVLERARTASRKYRLRLWYGDPATGKLWGDVETGYIGRSMGPIKVPLLIANNRSSGGPALLDHCIVKIAHANKSNGGVLYKHPWS